MRVRRLPTPESTADLIRKQIQDRPRLGIILGSGFGAQRVVRVETYKLRRPRLTPENGAEEGPREALPRQ